VSRIEAIIYDFGGVVVDWNPRNLYRKLFDDEADMERFLDEIWSPAENDRCDRGRPYAEMVDELSARFPDHADHIAACAPTARWIETISGPIPGALELLDELRDAGYPLYGLSNWSAETFPLARGEYAAFARFDDILISGELDGIAKPDRAMFDLLAGRNGLSPESTVFIDDSPRNTEAAASYGYHVVDFTSTDRLRRELVALGVAVREAGDGTSR
jgi:2-haloacid dehalogenase